MKRALSFVALALLAGTSVAHAQQATPEDFGVSSSEVPPQPAPQPTAPPAPQPSVEPAPQPAPAPFPTAAAAVDDDEAKGRKFRPAAKFQLGYQYAPLHGIPIQAGRARVGVGGQNDDQAHFATFAMMVGETETGRRAWDLRFGYSGELRALKILRLGLGLEMGYVFVRRASIDERMWALGIGAEAHVGVDAVTWGPRGDHALYLEGRIEGHMHFGNADMWGPTLSLGIRF